MNLNKTESATILIFCANFFHPSIRLIRPFAARVHPPPPTRIHKSLPGFINSCPSAFECGVSREREEFGTDRTTEILEFKMAHSLPLLSDGEREAPWSLQKASPFAE